MISDRFEKIPTSYDFGYGKTGSVVVFGGVEYCYKVAVDDDVDDDDDDEEEEEEEERDDDDIFDDDNIFDFRVY